MERSEHAAWLAKVKEYILLGDRSEEPCFVGRDDLFEAVAGQIEVSAADPRGRTMVLCGAPGAGKSAFLRELAHRLAASGDAVPVTIDSSQCTPWGIFEALSQVVGVEARDKTERTSTKGVGAAVLPIRGKLDKAVKTTTEADIARVGAQPSVPWGLMVERFAEHLHGRPIALLCDEIQALDTSDPNARGAVRSLHVGNSTFPVLPVFAGLSDAPDVLEGCGVTRPSGGNEQIVQPLAINERVGYAEAVLDHLEAVAEPTVVHALARWIAECSDGWPQHLRISTSAVAKAMLDAETPHLASLDADAIRQRVNDARNEFYSQRLRAATPAGTDATPALALMAARARDRPEGLTISDLADSATEGNAGSSLPPNAQDVVRAAIHAGVLQSVSTQRRHRYTCPIPSMARWLQGEEYQAPHLAWPSSAQHDA